MTKEYKIHAWYVLSILVIIIIGLATVKWATIPGLVNYIQFALTAVALTLGILAIFYNVYSNITFFQNLTALNIASKDIATTGSTLTGVTADLGRKVEAFPGMIEKMSVKVEETQQLVKGFSESRDPKLIETPEQRETIQIPKGFLNTTSLLGLVSLYACFLAHDRKISFNLKDLTSKIGDPYEYLYGYLVAISSLGIITTNVSQGIWNILDINEVIARDIEPQFKEKSKHSDAEFGTTLSEERIKRVEGYFAHP